MRALVARRVLVIAVLIGSGCLDSPPSSTDADADAAGGPPLCGELDLFIEDFGEVDPDPPFRELWDPGGAVYRFSDGTLYITGISTETEIYSRYEYERSGGLRFEKMTLVAGGDGAVSVWNETDDAARILLNDTSTIVYAPGNYQMELERDVEDTFFAIVFDHGAIDFLASHDGTGWRTLISFPDEFTGLVRLGLAASHPTDVTELSIAGINTPVTGLDCVPPLAARR